MNRPKNPNDLSLFLKETRELQNLSLRQVEAKTNGAISNPYLSQLENGIVKSPSIKMLSTLAKVYNVSFVKLARLAAK